jgi:hypothetical protein
MDVPGMQREQQEGGLAEPIERQTSKVPSDLFLWTALGCVAVALGLQVSGRKQGALFVGEWVPTILIFGVYNKIVKTFGHDVYRRDVH